MQYLLTTQQLHLLLSFLLLGCILYPPLSLGGIEPQQENSAVMVESGSQRLIGTAVSRNPADNFAVIENMADGRQWIYREGDLVGKTLIRKIQPDRIIVDNGHGEEVVNLQRSLIMQSVRGRSALSPAIMQPRRDPTQKNSARKLYYLINGSAFADAFADPGQLLAIVEMQPGKGLGRQEGVRLGDFAPESLFAAFGLRKGDLLLAVNGREVAAPVELVAMLRTMLESGQAEIKVRRRARTYYLYLQKE